MAYGLWNGGNTSVEHVKRSRSKNVYAFPERETDEEEGILAGYSDTQKEHRIFHPSFENVTITRTALIYETSLINKLSDITETAGRLDVNLSSSCLDVPQSSG